MAILQIRHIRETAYIPVWQAMQNYTAQRDADSMDQFWIVEHAPVYTLGLNGKTEHLIKSNQIPVVQVDRGGQVTYHGPGQLVIYLLLDLKRKGINVRQLVSSIEQSVIQLLAQYQLSATQKDGAPGVYIDGKKISALGLRVRRGRCYHGLSLNIDMDLSPFKDINPCGYKGLETTQLVDWLTTADYQEITQRLIHQLAHDLGYTIDHNEWFDLPE